VGHPREVDSELLDVVTSDRPFSDLTPDLSRFCRGRGDGLLHVFAPHATAGLALIELGAGTEPDVLELLQRLLPRDHRVSPSVTLPVLDGQVALGTWQSVVLVDLNADNPRRHVRLSFLPG
jgi:thiamine phosphate synthase YjbQ (UPF0047 family)